MDYIYQTPIQKRSKAAEFRRVAWEALKNKWWIAIGVGLIAGALGGATTSGFSGSVSTSFSYSNGEAIGGTQIIIAAVAMLLVSGFAMGAAIFVGGPAMVGYARFNLDLIDGIEPLTPLPVFWAFRFCYWKAVGVHALIALIQTAVGAVTLTPVVFLTFFAVRFDEIGQVGLSVLMIFLMLALVVAFFVINVIITYRFVLCSFILTEYPSLSVTDVLRNSATLMKGNKWRYFCLEMSFFGWILLAVFGTCCLGFVALTPYMSAASAAFYNEVSGREMAKDVEFPSINPEDYYQI